MAIVWQVYVTDSQNAGIGVGFRDSVIQPIISQMGTLRPCDVNFPDRMTEKSGTRVLYSNAF